MRIPAILLTIALALSCFGQTVGTDKKSLARLDALQAKAKAAYQKRPKDGSIKKQYVEATVRYGTACMTSDDLDRKVKYRKALRLYREALKVDPTNKEALNNKKLIESIYRSMGRPIPN